MERINKINKVSKILSIIGACFGIGIPLYVFVRMIAQLANVKYGNGLILFFVVGVIIACIPTIAVATINLICSITKKGFVASVIAAILSGISFVVSLFSFLIWLVSTLSSSRSLNPSNSYTGDIGILFTSLLLFFPALLNCICISELKKLKNNNEQNAASNNNEQNVASNNSEATVNQPVAPKDPWISGQN